MSVARGSNFIVTVMLPMAVAACAMQVPVTTARLQPLVATADEFQVARDTSIKLATGYGRVLPAGSRWRAVGVLPQGVVYQPVNSVFSIEGRQVHEAYLVVRDGALQGFFLPAESNFSPLSPTLPLPQGVQR